MRLVSLAALIAAFAARALAQGSAPDPPAALPPLSVAAAPTSTAPNPALHPVRKPTGPEISRALAANAGGHYASGKAVMRCVVRSTGELDDCALLSETPAGSGIGATLLALAATYRVSLPQPGASPVIDIPMTIEMR